MLIYHPESDALFWDPDFKFTGADGSLCSDVTDELWAVERALEMGIEMPFGTENRMNMLIEQLVEVREMERSGLPDEDDPYWSGL